MPEIRLLSSIHDVDPANWNGLWNTRYPFLQHAFLAALEDSGSVCPETGWRPCHLLATEAGQLVAAMPLYEKTHSYGEYVFDWGWAEAYQRHGLAYYPKLLNAIPFTPSTGPRLALAPGTARGTLMAAIQEFLATHCRRREFSSWHSLFHPAEDQALWQQQQLLMRSGCQFHWFNRGYSGFDHFLQGFNSRKRKAVRKERQQVQNQGVQLTRQVGSEIDARDWDLFYRFYHTTYLKRSGGGGYLTREFFEAIAGSMAEQILMVCASYRHQTIAAALCFFDDSHLFGRYWGCLEEIPGLHFETCYYQGIEFAIERGLQVFDPGAQGEHKIQRGFEPITTCSAHWIADPRFRAAIDDFLRRERAGVEAYRQDCANYLPFRKANP